MKANCKYCGKPLNVSNKRIRYCSDSCREKALIEYQERQSHLIEYKRYKENKCKQCGKWFIPTMTYQHFCSPNCRETFFQKAEQKNERR